MSSDRHRPTLPDCTPDYRVVILGAGRGVRGNLPSAMVAVDCQSTVLEWLLSAFAGLPSPEITFVTGYGADAVMRRHPGIRYVLNPQWDRTGPSGSLRLTSLSSGTATYICYSDVLFRGEIVARLERQTADLVLAVDRRWNDRYDGRSAAEKDGAEKVVCDGDRLIDIGKHVATCAADAEFAGVLKMSPKAADRLQCVLTSGELSDDSGLPDAVGRLVHEDLSTAFVDVDGQWAELNAPQDLARFVLGTKAESLERLKPLLRCGRIGEQIAFDQREWQSDYEEILNRVGTRFRGETIIVRSSARREDGWDRSHAGAYASVRDVPADDAPSLRTAIETVIESYGEFQPYDQVLVQQMLSDVTLSGVIMTRSPGSGAPYYVINFDDQSRRTDTVTGGDGRFVRTVVLHRGDELREGLPGELTHLIRVVQEIESLVLHDSVDVEFAFTADDEVHILQVRPIPVGHIEQPVDDEAIASGLRRAKHYLDDLQTPPPHVLGNSTQLSVMTDWNPAEMIGTKPNRLALSLYRHLITRENWARQRAEYGYRDVRPCDLMIDILGHPYIDVRASFNSFVPASLPDPLAARLVDHYLQRLADQPELHDKVEFEILHTCLAFDFDLRADSLRDAGFGGEDIEALRRALLNITRNGIIRCANDEAELSAIQHRFARLRSAELPPLERAYLLLEDARLYGVPHFAHLARNAFVAVSMLRSLCAVGVITQEESDAFLASVRTVTGRLQSDAGAVARGKLRWESFVDTYGHLRPGTYDITSPHYGCAPDEYLQPIVDSNSNGRQTAPVSRTPWSERTRGAVGRELSRLGLDLDVEYFLSFLRQAVESRELAKFIFTRNVCAALESLAAFAESHSVRRQDVAHVTIDDLYALRFAGAEETDSALRRLARSGQEAHAVTQAVCLPDHILRATDCVCFEQPQSVPNFVTHQKTRAEVFRITSKTPPNVDLAGKIALAQSADPGFDWIFSRKISGLITKYGGANSHMAIRASEFRVPAAIGVGPTCYERVERARLVEMDCACRQIRIMD